MAHRPGTAASAISSAISDDGETSQPLPALKPPPSIPQPISAHHVSSTSDYVNSRGLPTPNIPSTRTSVRGSSSTPASSRPQSPVSQVSRSHVPSLTAHGFFKPMSSQRLQAQRFARPQATRNEPPTPRGESVGDLETETGRSMSTNRQGPYAPMPEHERAPPSRGTEFTDPVIPDRTTNASPTGNTTVRSLGDNVRLLNERSAMEQAKSESGPQNLTLGRTFKPSMPQDQPQKSPPSFHSNFSRSNRRVTRQSPGPGHQHLSSNSTSHRDHVPKPSTPDHAKPQLGRNYEYFEGNTMFFLCGRIQNARDRPVNIATGIFLILPAILFFIFSAPWLWQNVSPAVPLVFAYLFYICLSSFIHASTIDPGILPRNLHPFPPPGENEDPLAIGPPANDWVMIRLATSDTAAMDVPVKYCKTCNIWRPPRCYHCRVCDNCVETLDHHCVWLNNCVGRRNYRYFFTFISSATILGLYLIGATLGHCLAYRAQQGISFRQSINHWRIPFAMFIYGIIATTYPACLCSYHLYLMGRGETTRELLTTRKFAKADRHRPFNQGNVFKNWISVFGRPRPPTYLHFKQKYEDGDPRFGPRRGKPQALLVEDAQGGGMEMKPVRGGLRSFNGPDGKEGRPDVPR